MKVEATVTKRTVPRIVPIFTQIQNIIESTTVLNGRVQSRRTHFLLVGLFSIFYIIFCQFMVRIGIHPSIYFGAHLAVFYEFCFFDVLHVSSFGSLFLQFILLKTHIFDQASPCLVSYILEGLVNLSRSFFIFCHCAATDTRSGFLRSETFLLFAFGFIFHILVGILNI